MTEPITLEDRSPDLNPRQIRSSGMTPVTIYGKLVQPSLSMQVDTANFSRRLSRYVHALPARVRSDGTEHLLVIKSIERNPVTDQIRNVQFHSVRQDERVDIDVPIDYLGASPLVQAGGTLLLMHHRAKITCAAKDIPGSLQFRLDSLSGSLNVAYYRDLHLPAGVSLRDRPEQVIAKVSLPQAVKAAA